MTLFELNGDNYDLRQIFQYLMSDLIENRFQIKIFSPDLIFKTIFILEIILI